MAKALAQAITCTRQSSVWKPTNLVEHQKSRKNNYTLGPTMLKQNSNFSIIEAAMD